MGNSGVTSCSTHPSYVLRATQSQILSHFAVKFKISFVEGNHDGAGDFPDMKHSKRIARP